MKETIAKSGYINYERLNISQQSKAVFLDRDGTIIVDKVETRRIEDLEFFDDIESLKELLNSNYILVIVTNQSGIGKGHYTVEEMTTFNEHMLQELKKRGIDIDALYYCPHKQEDNCQCKKPKDGMIRRAAMDLNINLSKSYIIGDQNTDIMSGINAGLNKCFAVTTGLYPQNQSSKYEVYPTLKGDTVVCSSLKEAVEIIVKDEFICCDR